jgi:hypothetical protein
MNPKLYIWGKWFIYTFLAGLIPILARLAKFYSPMNEIKHLLFQYTSCDIIIFGLILNITIINEILNSKAYDSDNRAIIIGVSTLLIIYSAIIYSISLSDIKNDIYLPHSIILSLGSLIVNFIHINIMIGLEMRRLKMKEQKGRQ